MTEMSPLGTAVHVSRTSTRDCRDGAAAPAEKAGPRALRRRHENRRRRGQGAAVGRPPLRRPAGARARGSSRSYYKGEATPLTVTRPGWFPDRRRGDDRSGRLHADHRPQQGRDQVGRRMDQFDRDREHRHVPPGGGDGSLHRGAASEVGRAAAAGRGAKPGAGSAARNCWRTSRAGWPSGRSPTTWPSSTHPARRDRQDAEDQTARAVHGL